jgi:hypothetical protein
MEEVLSLTQFLNSARPTNSEPLIFFRSPHRHCTHQPTNLPSITTAFVAKPKHSFVYTTRPSKTPLTINLHPNHQILRTSRCKSNTLVRKKMKLLTLNFLTCARKACKQEPAAFPLHPRDAELERVEQEVNPEFLVNVLPRLDWKAIRSLSEEVSLNPPTIHPHPPILLFP